MIQFNKDVFKKYPQTISYIEWRDLKKENQFYNGVVDNILDYCMNKFETGYNIYSGIDRDVIDRILSYYLIPQNHNDLTFPSLHQHNSSFKTLVHKYVKYGLIKIVFKEHNCYYVFCDDIVKLIKREYSLYSVGV